MKTQNKGFTLSELLIALAILGLIATFTIPKVLQTTESNQRKAVFKETIGSITEIAYDMWHQNRLGDQDYFLSRLNIVKYCNPGATGDCWTAAMGNSETQTIAPAATLQNGVVISRPNVTNRSYMIIDYNGQAGPNTFGEDQIGLTACFDATPCTSGDNDTEVGGGGPKNNVVGPSKCCSDSVTLWNWIFSN